MFALTLSRSSVTQLRRRAAAMVVDSAYENLGKVTGWLPPARPELHGVERIKDLAYRDTGLAAHQLDVYRTKNAAAPLPVVIYIHGGAFRALSKDTHWLMGLIFARRGYLCFNLNYRLAPQNRYPAAVEDVCHGFEWVVQNAARFGGDLSRLVLAGESAGGNLSTALAVASTYRSEAPWAKRVFDLNVVPSAVAPVCGMLQVSDQARHARRRKLPGWLIDQLEHCAEGYLPDGDCEHGLELADPLRVLETRDPERKLPPFFAAVGTKDPLLDDTRRLAGALAARGTRCDVRYFEGEMHAFHALIWRRKARDCWRQMFEFFSDVV